ncbi:hypothetical protein N7539_008467 [Penicillium diatomitis]|uniref:Uncharacterized protein n=1 Tax=Penicillium diatomitis TaxID=2819901 RepID=A0A9W9WQQ8_9EURO|nr:uncharacterized protein N7539_008467 [Penicillium diatomitis]KAJ5471898.1 hypothetical protein N7539_008467 [Penicillium diatomitis]
MSKNKFRRLLPAKEKEETEPVVTEAKKETRRNISLAFTECQKKKTKVTVPVVPSALERRHAQGVQPKPAIVYTIKAAIADAKHILPGC